MSNITIYTDLDSLWDTRRAVLERLLPEGDTWDDHYAKQYADRRIDHFAKPELGITQEKYKTAYANRDISLFEKAFPSRLLPKILTIVLDVENFIGKPISIGEFKFTINIWPFVLDDELKSELESALSKSIVYNHSIFLTSVPKDRLNSTYFKPFTHVFKYDAMGEDSKALLMSLQEAPIPGTKFFIPDIHQQDPGSGVYAEPEEIIHKMSVFLASAFTIIPVKHSVYDYRLSS